MLDTYSRIPPITPLRHSSVKIARSAEKFGAGKII
jgi:hypothetical protein